MKSVVLHCKKGYEKPIWPYFLRWFLHHILGAIRILAAKEVLFELLDQCNFTKDIAVFLGELSKVSSRYERTLNLIFAISETIRINKKFY